MNERTDHAAIPFKELLSLDNPMRVIKSTELTVTLAFFEDKMCANTASCNESDIKVSVRGIGFCSMLCFDIWKEDQWRGNPSLRDGVEQYCGGLAPPHNSPFVQPGGSVANNPTFKEWFT